MRGGGGRDCEVGMWKGRSEIAISVPCGNRFDAVTALRSLRAYGARTEQSIDDFKKQLAAGAEEKHDD